MTRRIYAGIGSRQTPPLVLTLMAKWAVYLAQSGYTLRSGGAFGADCAFENGCDIVQGVKQIFTANDARRYPHWREHAAKFHPVWRDLTAGMQLLHARNSAIVLGQSLAEPVDFVLCWTPDGTSKGGTGQALRIAADEGIPIFNFWNSIDANERLRAWLNQKQ